MGVCAIERVHMQFCKQILGVKRCTQNDFIYGELGRSNFQTLRYFNIIKYWVKLLSTDYNKFTKKVYCTLLHDCDRYPNKKSWCSLLKDLICSLGYYEVWVFQGVGNDKSFLYNVRQRLTDNFIQNWNSRLENSSRALFYKNIASFRLQPYLKACNIKKFRFSLSRLRMSSHRLNIESGRWSKPTPIPIDQRICNICHVLEDEFHFVLQCEAYIDIREMYIPLYYRRRPNMHKFVQLINTDNQTLLRKLSIFIYKAFMIRSTNLYVNNV